MGSRGVDLPAIASKLGAIKDSAIIAESDAVSHTDIPAFLKAEREEAILGLLEETKKETVERLQVFFFMTLFYLLTLNCRHATGRQLLENGSWTRLGS